MRKCVKRLGCCLFLAVLIWAGAVLTDRQKLNEELIRLHVVAASDSDADQRVKLQVRDAVTTYLQENLPRIQTIANQVLAAAGMGDTAVVQLKKERFDTRFYDTFRLPAGVYESLRIIIGEGEGKNWWCVVFPSLCLPATTSGFESVAAGAGFDAALLGALEGKPEYEIRFFLLDKLGELQNKFFRD